MAADTADLEIIRASADYFREHDLWPGTMDKPLSAGLLDKAYRYLSGSDDSGILT